MKIELRPRARRSDLVVQRSGDETLIYDLIANEAKCLSSSAAFIWDRCDGIRSAAEHAAEFTHETNKSVPEEFILLAFDELSRHGLLLEMSAGAVNGVSRRQMIKKVGLASMAVLPLVASIVAPLSVHAQTCIPNDGSCATSSQCCSNCCKNVSPGANQCKPGSGACLA